MEATNETDPDNLQCSRGPLGGKRIGDGDVQWMTAGAGILHEEYHSWTFSENGGPLEHGPFVMNTQDEIRQAMKDFQSGKFGLLHRQCPSGTDVTKGRITGR